MLLLNILSLILIIQNTAFGQTSIVAVGNATIEKTSISFSVDENCNCIEIANIIRSDLEMYKTKLSVYDSDLAEIGQFDYEFNLIRAENIYQLLEKSNGKSSSMKEFLLPPERDDDRYLAHKIADTIYQRIFNKSSIFLSKIYYISDIGLDENGKNSKQLFVIDYDGENKKQLTSHDGYVFSPAISEDRSHAIYSVILNNEKNKNVNLYMMDLKDKDFKIISSFKGINSGAVFVPNSDEIILTLTHSGKAELYKTNTSTKKLFPLTRHFSSDVDPSISPDGKTLAFLSTRAGKPMIYTLSTEKTEYMVKRISFVGDYNATPRFSPDGESIVFSSWLDNKFDLFRLGRKGMNLVRLTKDHGSNEGPSFSPDGEFIVFSSQRILNETQDVKNLYIMTKDGEILKKISSSLGRTESPSWVK